LWQLRLRTCFFNFKTYLILTLKNILTLGVFGFCFLTAPCHAQVISAGLGYSLAVCDDDSTLWSWGGNHKGQLGNGTTAESSIPAKVPGLSGIRGVTTGKYSSYALQSDGTLWAWGNNEYGQLGNGTTADSKVPLQVSLSGVAQISVGWEHCVALRDDGTVWAWGKSSCGQLGDGTTGTSTLVPQQVPGLSNIISVAAGRFGMHTLALQDDGTVWAWGHNTWGQLGIGSYTHSAVPVKVSNLSGVVSISAGGFHSLALLADGTLRVWGCNASGQLGNGSNNAFVTLPQSSPLDNVWKISAGYMYSSFLRNDGTVWGCGYNMYGTLGDGTSTDKIFPVQVLGQSGVIEISSGDVHTLGVVNNGQIWGWGRNGTGELGTGSKATSGCYCTYIPVQSILLCEQTVPLNLLSLSAERKNGKVEVAWKLTDESGISHFRVERSADGYLFEEAGNTKDCMFCSLGHYSFTDRDPYPGPSYYRVASVSGSGQEEVSDPVAVSSGTPEYRLTLYSPNPVNQGESIRLGYQDTYGSSVSIRLTGITGNVLFEDRRAASCGQVNIEIPTQSLPAGIYILSASGFSGTESRKILVK
jgi:hypothetical protein